MLNAEFRPRPLFHNPRHLELILQTGRRIAQHTLVLKPGTLNIRTENIVDRLAVGGRLDPVEIQLADLADIVHDRPDLPLEQRTSLGIQIQTRQVGHIGHIDLCCCVCHAHLPYHPARERKCRL